MHHPIPALSLLILALLATGCDTLGGLDNPGVRATDRTGTFQAAHDFELTVPAGAAELDAWFAMPQADDPAQTVRGWRVESPYPTRVVTDTQGNEFLYLHADRPPAGSFAVKTAFELERHEVAANLDPAATRPHTAAERAAMAAHLQPGSQDVADQRIQQLAAEAVGDETNPILASRRIYDVVLDRVEYHVKDPKTDALKSMQASGQGSSFYTYEQCTGNCTDFHSLYTAMSRSVGIPTRLVYGSFFKGPLDGADSDQSYHCWVEFHAPGIGWIPLDVAVADIFVDDFHANENSRPRANLTVADGYAGPDAGLVDYYFGNLEERRVVWHRGRDLVMSPRQRGEPLLWNPKAYVEIDGKSSSDYKRKLTFTQVRFKSSAARPKETP